MKKFDPLVWEEIDAKTDYPVSGERLRLNLSASAPIYLTVEGVEVLLAVAQSIDVQVKGSATFKVDTDNARCFLYVPHSQARKPSGEVFTNLDRTPSESGSMLAVQKALRQDALERQAFRREMAKERADLQRERINARKTQKLKEEPVDDFEPQDPPEKKKAKPAPEPTPELKEEK